MSKSDPEHSDIAIARPEKKKKKIEEENGSEREGMKIKLEQFLSSIGIKKTIFVSHNKPNMNSKVISKILFW